MTKVLVTGAAGFIGFDLARALCAKGYEVVGIDNLNAYYDVALKEARLSELKKLRNFSFEKMDIVDGSAMEKLFSARKFDYVMHMAAQAGVRYSIENPHVYIESNVVGFTNILEGCRHHKVKHLVYASSSSVYGANKKIPFSTADNVDRPISLYAATKRANELMAHTYAHLYGLPCMGLRFFTVYGPWGRPDMAVYGFTKAIIEGKPINVFNNGDMQRDFTYVADVTEALVRLVEKTPAADAASGAPYKLYNIGNHNPVKLLDMISMIEAAVGKKAVMNMKPMQPGDVPATYADTADLRRDIGFEPSMPLKDGIGKFVDWYKQYHKIP